jgi:hypothetical protein
MGVVTLFYNVCYHFLMFSIVFNQHGFPKGIMKYSKRTLVLLFPVARLRNEI